MPARIPPEEEWRWRVKSAELALFLGPKVKLTLSPRFDGGRKMGTIAPHKALPLADDGSKLIEQLRKLSDEYHSLVPPAWPDEDHEALGRILKKLEQSFGVLFESEERLKRLGIKFDRNREGKPRKVAKGNAGRDFLYDMAWGSYLTLQRIPEFKGEGNTHKIRRKIAADLSPYGFSEDELDTRARAGAPIYAALRHRLKRG